MSRKSTVSQSAPADNGAADPRDFPFGANDQTESAAPSDTAADTEPITRTAETPPPASDPFDPASLRLSQDLAASLGVKKILLSVPVDKPEKNWFVRVHPDERFHLHTALIVLKAERETYLVAPALWPELASEPTFAPHGLFTAINRQGSLFLWKIRLPGSDGRTDEWSRTALEAAQLAMKS